PATPDPSDAGGQTMNIVDAGVAEPDATMPTSNVYPAPHAPLPLVESSGGRVLVAPKIVTVTFPDDTLKDRVEAFGDMITASPWWQAATVGYCSGAACISPGSGGGHVVMPAAPALSYTDDDIQALIKAEVLAGRFPAPTADTIYALYFPMGAKVSLGTGFDGCTAFDGYHGSVVVHAPDVDAGAADAGGTSAAIEVAYAVMMRCTSQEAEVTLTAGHEFIEAATDPNGGDGYLTTDPAWQQFFYPEVGDLCDAEGYQYESGFVVQSGWSNVSAKAGHNPCAPQKPGEIYFNAAPTKKSVLLKVGESTTIDVQAYSEAVTDDWALSVVDYDVLMGTGKTLDVSLDRDSVNNGVTAKLTIKLLKAPPVGRPFGLYAITSKRAGVTHYWPAMVEQK
ncbi:MAG: hypothetical protein ABIP89_16310, partial [Polyangiaceae bacterium]